MVFDGSQFSLLNDEQMSNKVRVEQQPIMALKSGRGFLDELGIRNLEASRLGQFEGQGKKWLKHKISKENRKNGRIVANQPLPREFLDSRNMVVGRGLSMTGAVGICWFQLT